MYFSFLFEISPCHKNIKNFLIDKFWILNTCNGFLLYLLLCSSMKALSFHMMICVTHKNPQFSDKNAIAAFLYIYPTCFQRGRRQTEHFQSFARRARERCPKGRAQASQYQYLPSFSQQRCRAGTTISPPVHPSLCRNTAACRYTYLYALFWLNDV